MKLIVCMIAALSLAGCYANWPELDDLAVEIDCKMQRQDIELLAKDYQAQSLWDDETKALTLRRFDDAILVVFDQRQKRLATVAKTRSTIKYFGLIRSQGDVDIVKRCIKA